MKKRTLRIRSRHPSHSALRNSKLLLPALTVMRLGSTTTLDRKYDVEINSVESIKNSASKLLMKQKFTDAGVKTAEWWFKSTIGAGFVTYPSNVITQLENLPYPIIMKHIYGSRGTGNYKINNQQELEVWMAGKDITKYIAEKFYSMLREYRLHIGKGLGCFYACRKMLKNDTPIESKWSRHSDNSVWVISENPLFDKPVNWNDIVADCEKALNALGLDIAAFDVKIQSAKNSEGNARPNPEWIIIESNSAPSLAELGTQKYVEAIPKIVERKLNHQ